MKRIRRTVRRPTTGYTVLTVAGFGLCVVGTGLIFAPAAFIVAGLGIGALGLIGLGMRETSP